MPIGEEKESLYESHKQDVNKSISTIPLSQLVQLVLVFPFPLCSSFFLWLIFHLGSRCTTFFLPIRTLWLCLFCPCNPTTIPYPTPPKCFREIVETCLNHEGFELGAHGRWMKSYGVCKQQTLTIYIDLGWQRYFLWFLCLRKYEDSKWISGRWK